jgi:hypothetical protein
MRNNTASGYKIIKPVGRNGVGCSSRREMAADRGAVRQYALSNVFIVPLVVLKEPLPISHGRRKGAGH